MSDLKQYLADIQMLEKQGYTVVYDGMVTTVLHRGEEEVVVKYGQKYGEAK